MCRLPVVGPARLDAVVRTDRNVDHLLEIAIEVADEEADAAVGFVEPAFERARHRFARVPVRTERERRRLRLGEGRPEGLRCDRERDRCGNRSGRSPETHRHCCCG